MSKKNKTKPTFPSDVKFLHIRYQTQEGQILSGGGTTVAYRPTDGGVEYAMSRCHPRDNYVKVLGRIKAAGRLASKQRKTFEGDEAKFHELLEVQMQGWNYNEQFQLASEGYDPAQAVRMFRKYTGKRKGAAATEEVAE